jgi:hypothetical protein
MSSSPTKGPVSVLWKAGHPHPEGDGNPESYLTTCALGVLLTGED